MGTERMEQGRAFKPGWPREPPWSQTSPVQKKSTSALRGTGANRAKGPGLKRPGLRRPGAKYPTRGSPNRGKFGHTQGNKRLATMFTQNRDPLFKNLQRSFPQWGGKKIPSRRDPTRGETSKEGATSVSPHQEPGDPAHKGESPP